MPDRDPELFDLDEFAQVLATAAHPIKSFRNALKKANQVLAKRFEQRIPAAEQVKQRAWLIDQLLTFCWEMYFEEPYVSQLALIAVGGYGRAELHLYSDIDLMILLPDEIDPEYRDSIEQFLMMLWDIGLEVGHSVRTVAECINQGAGDITIATNLMEARLITGSEPLFNEMRANVGPDRIWPTPEFFSAKLHEQITRHNKYNYTSYNLEPNLKEGPGGLRDIQIIGWIAKRHFGATTLYDLVKKDFLTEDEYQLLEKGQAFLWRIRNALHLTTKRREDRLLFEHQRNLAKLFGYKDSKQKLAVEQFMMDYYRNIKELSRLNEMLLQLFKEEILYAGDPEQAKPINDRFQLRKGFLEATRPTIFKETPSALLELFLLLEHHPNIKGVRAGTIRLIRENLHLIDSHFRHNPVCNELFIEILSAPEGVTHELRRMHRYGILGAYLPNFNNIIGQMQHDLFHVYTVDEHTLRVLRNVRRFSVPEFAHEFPLCSKRFNHINKPELLYIAALFHDIAKGRGGDHSILGIVDAGEFCQQHMLPKEDTELVCWLVNKHLLMSTTAQRKDLSDPDAINEFASLVGNQQRLDYLYLLTVADIRGTSPDVWNSWKDALLKELFNATSRALRRGLDNPLDHGERINYTKKLALEDLALHRIRPQESLAVWEKVNEEYFLTHTADEIAWQTRHVIIGKDRPLPQVFIRQMTRRGGTEIFLYAPDKDFLFAKATAALEQLNLNIADARIVTSNDGFTLDTFIVLDGSGEAISDPECIQRIDDYLKKYLAMEDTSLPTITKRMPTQLKHFPIPTEVSFNEDRTNKRSIMKVVTSDRPGVLARIGAALWKCEIRLQNAKIATFGERVEDLFFITTHDNRPLNDPDDAYALRQEIIKQLDG